MTLVDLKTNIQHNTIPNFNIFTGDEVAVMDIYVNKIASTKGLEVRHIDTLKDVIGSIGKSSLFKQNYLYVVRDDKEFMKNEKAWDLLNSRLKSDIVILIITNVDKRTKFYSAYKSSIIEFNALTDIQLCKYILKDIELSKKACNELIKVCESDYSRILLEIDKIKNYQQGLNIDEDYMDEAFYGLLEQGVIYQPPKDAIFAMVQAIMEYKPRLVYELYENCKGVGEGNLVIISVLYNTIKQTLQVQSCKSSDVAKDTGLTSWQVKCVSNYVGVYTTSTLVFMLRKVQEVEIGIKSGVIEDELSIEYLLSQIL